MARRPSRKTSASRKKKAMTTSRQISDNDRYSAIMKVLPDIVYQIDTKGKFLFVSDAVDMLGYKPEELIGKHYRTIIHPDDVEKFARKNVLPKYRGKVTGDENSPKLIDERRTGARKTKNLEVRLIHKKETKKTDPVYAEIVAVGDLTATGHYNTSVESKRKKFLGTLGIIHDITARKQVEQKLHYQADMLRHVSDAIISTDLDFNIRTWNPAAEEMYGWKFHEVEGKPVEKVTQLEYPHNNKKEVIDEFFRKGKWSGEVLQRNREGKQLTIHASVVLMHDYYGKPIGTVAINRDITELKKAHTELQYSEEKYRLVSENIPVAVYSVLPDEHSNSTFISRQIKDITGYSSEEFVKNPELFTKMIHPADRKEVWRRNKDHRKRKSILDIEYRIVTKDKQTKWIRDRATPVLDEKGNILQITGYMEDITEKKHTEDELLKSEIKYRNIVENTGVGVATTNLKGEFTFVNDRLCTMLGYSKDEFIGSSFASYLHPEDKKRIMDIFIGALTYPKGQVDLHFRTIHKNGSTVHMYSSPTVHEMNGKIIGFNAIIQDISRLRIAEEEIKQRNYELAALNSVNEVISNSLDLNAMLSSTLKKILDIINLDAGAIYLFNNEMEKIKLHVHHGISKNLARAVNEIRIDDKILQNVYEMIERKDYLFTPATTLSNLKTLPGILNALRKENIHPDYITMILLYSKNHIVGLLVVASKTHHDLTQRDTSLLVSITQQITVAILNAQLYSRSKSEIAERRKAEQKIHKSLKEKEALLREIHHRVKNNLQIISSLLNLQADQIDDEYYKHVFKESQTRIRSMVLVHEKLYQSRDIAHVNTETYLTSLIYHLFQTYGIRERSIDLDIDIQDFSMDIDTAIPCGLIINELVSNALKYAFQTPFKGKPALYVAASMKNSTMNMKISDNGIGLPHDIDVKKAKTLGLQLVHALVEQLNGALSVKRDKGTTYQLTFTAR